MADKKDEHASNNEAHDSHLTFEERIAHLATAYSNSQSVVRFLDTKAAAVLGGVPVLVGILAAVFGWFKESSQWRAVLDLVPNWIPITFATVIFGLLLLFTWRTMKAAFAAIQPREPDKTLPSVLFPFAADGFETRLSVFTHEPKRSDAIEDYRRQIVRMSRIVASKSADVKRAIRRLTHLLVLSFAALVAMLLIEALSIGITVSQQSSLQNDLSDSKAQTTPLQDCREPADE